MKIMATKDLLKYFKDENEYSSPLTKEDMDNNLVTLADAIDNTPFTTDDDYIFPTSKNKGKTLKIGNVKIKESEIRINKAHFSENKIQSNVFIVDENMFRTSYCFIRRSSFTILDNDISNVGAMFGAVVMKKITTDENKTYLQDNSLFKNSTAIFKINCFAVDTDFNEKWGFERIVLAINNNDNVSIEVDNNNDLIKTNDNLKFDIEAEDNKIRMAVTGLADTTIHWTIKIEAIEGLEIS